MMKKMDKKAFTLIELLVVIAVVGILVLLVAPRFMGHTQKAELIRIQHDARVMEEEMRTVLINGDDDFNEWENNMKDLNQLAQEDKLFEKEGFATEVDDSHIVANKTVDLRKYASQLEPSNKTKLNVGGELHELDLSISETYKVIPERYKDEINSKLKGTFYANSDGKVYYEHVKSLSRILTKSEEPEEEPVLEGPIPIATAEELNNVRNATVETYGAGTQWEGLYEGGLDKQYIQVADIDLSIYSQDGWNPIGTDTSRFTGTYDGENYVITNLDVKGEGENYQGLFGYIEEATISNVTLEGINVIGKDYVGGLVGYADALSGGDGTTIINSYATGSVEGTGTEYNSGSYVGGLVGRAAGKAGSNTTIRDSYAEVSVTGGELVGGLVGAANYNTIDNSHATGSVIGGSSSWYAGGLVGGISDNTNISNSYATGSVEVGSTGSMVGGLVGLTRKGTKVSNSYAEGNVTGGFDLGGLVGETDRTDISNSYATGSVTGKSTLGGLVGKATTSTSISSHYTKISNSYATGSVTSSELYRAGGLVGLADSRTEISNSYATGLVKGTRNSVGGFLGVASFSVKISNSYWDIDATDQANSAVIGEGEMYAGEGKTTAEMMNQATYSGWDLTNIWEITPGNYPTLR